MSNETPNKRLPHLRECYEAEKQRCSKVEQKASVYIGMLSVVGTILANGIIRLIQDDSMPAILVVISLIFLCIITCLMAASILYAIQAVRKRTYTYIDPKDVHTTYPEDELEKKLCDDYRDAIAFNQKPTNEKVDAMDTAQKLTRWAALLMIFFTVIITLIYFVHKYTKVVASFDTLCTAFASIFTTNVIACLALLLSIISVCVSIWLVSQYISIKKRAEKCNEENKAKGQSNICVLCVDSKSGSEAEGQ